MSPPPPAPQSVSADDLRSQTQASPLARHRSASRGGTQGTPETQRPITGALFPLSYKEGFAQWWAGVSPAVAEATVLSFLPFNTLPIPSTTTSTTHSAPTATPPAVDPYGPRVCSSTLVQLSGKDRSINEFAITRTGEEKQEDLVILHGYGAGLGFFYRNFDTLSRRPGWKMWALDLLGMGRSSRPPFKIHATDKDAKIREAEDWFIDALEEWRVKRGIDRFTVVGHSLGGYLATAYTLKYPGRIKKLILASPVGIPEDPWAVKENLPENPPKDQSHPPPPDTGLQSELLQPDDEVLKATPSTTGTAPIRASASTTSLPSTVSTTTTTTSTRPPPRRIPKWVHCLWEANVSPFSLVRWSGPLGPRLVSGWTSRRFSFLPTAESQALHTYSYSLFRQRGSGEYALAYILAPGAYARNPLIWRIGKVGIPTVLMYGEVDWMDVAGGYAAEEAIRQQGVRRDGDGWIGGEDWCGGRRDLERRLGKGRTEPREGEPGGGEAKVLIVKGAGHHVYLDGWEEFNEMIVREMEDVEERERRRRVWKEREKN